MPEMERRSFLGLAAASLPLTLFGQSSELEAPSSGLLVEVGSRRHRLKSGDSILGPRETPHAWAFVGNTPGRLILA